MYLEETTEDFLFSNEIEKWFVSQNIKYYFAVTLRAEVKDIIFCNLCYVSTNNGGIKCFCDNFRPKIQELFMSANKNCANKLQMIFILQH